MEWNANTTDVVDLPVEVPDRIANKKFKLGDRSLRGKHLNILSSHFLVELLYISYIFICS